MGKKELVYKRVLLIQFLIFLCCSGAFPQQGIKLFEVSQEAKMKLPAIELSRHYIDMNSTALRRGGLQQGDVLSFQFNEESQRYRVEKITSFTGNAFSVIAKSQEGNSGHLSFSVYRNRIRGTIHPGTKKKVYALTFDRSQNSNYIARLNPTVAGEFTCGVDELNMKRISRGTSRQKLSNSSTIAAEKAQIDLMITYTVEARQWMEDNGGLDLVLEDAMRINQEGLDNSNVSITLNLKKTHETGFDENRSNDGSEILRMLTAAPVFNPFYPDYEGIMEEIHQIRYDEQIDMVALLVDDLNGGGSSWIGPNSTYSFSVTKVNQIQFYALIHEIGHNFGNHHSRNQQNSAAGEDGGREAYATGWRWMGQDNEKYVSIMTYETGTDGERGERVLHFSNPAVNYAGTPTGSYNGQYAPADNARSMNEVGSLVATHDGKIPTLGFNQNRFSFEAAKATKEVEFDAYTDWEVIYPDNAFAFLANASQNKINQGSGSQQLFLLVEENTTSQKRTQVIEIKDKNGSYETSILIEQAAPDAQPEISVNPGSLNLNSKAGEANVEVSNSGAGTLKWSASIPADWLTISDGSSGTNEETIILLYEENTNTDERSTELKIESKNAVNSPVEVSISQEGKETTASISVSNESLDFGEVNLDNTQDKAITIENTGDAVLEGNISLGEESHKSYSFKGGGDYSIAAGESKKYTISFSPESEGEKSGRVQISHNGENESTTIEIPLTGQGVAEPEISTNSGSLNLDSESGETTIEISNSGTGSLSWTASTTAGWLTIKDGASGTGSGTITISYDENTETSNRLSVLTIESENAVNSPVEIEITQPGRDTPNAITVNYSPGWNLVSIPVKGDNLKLEDYFSSFNADRVYEFDGQYKRMSELTSGKGYWVKLNSDESVEFEGELVIENTISLKKGWNLIGTRVDTLKVANGLKDPSGIIEDGNVLKVQFNNSSGEYELVETDKILPGYGYFIKARESGEIILSK